MGRLTLFFFVKGHLTLFYFTLFFWSNFFILLLYIYFVIFFGPIVFFFIMDRFFFFGHAVLYHVDGLLFPFCLGSRVGPVNRGVQRFR